MTIRDVYDLALAHGLDATETTKEFGETYGWRNAYDAAETTMWLAVRCQEVS